MSDLGHRDAFGAIDNTGINPYGNGFWVAKFTPILMAIPVPIFEVYHATLRGPAGSSLQWWIDQEFFETTPRGDINSWDPNNPAVVRSGQTQYFFWNSAAGSAPQVTIRCRTAAVLR